MNLSADVIMPTIIALRVMTRMPQTVKNRDCLKMQIMMSAASVMFMVMATGIPSFF